MIAPYIDPALTCLLAHERRRHAEMPPLNDLPLTDGDVPPLDWRPPIAGVRWYEPRMLAGAAVGWAFIAAAVFAALMVT